MNDHYDPATDPHDHTWGEFADRMSHAGGYVRRAYERAQEGEFTDASYWMDSAVEEVRAAKALLPILRPMTAETVERIKAAR